MVLEGAFFLFTAFFPCGVCSRVKGIHLEKSSVLTCPLWRVNGRSCGAPGGNPHLTWPSFSPSFLLLRILLLRCVLLNPLSFCTLPVSFSLGFPAFHSALSWINFPVSVLFSVYTRAKGEPLIGCNDLGFLVRIRHGGHGDGEVGHTHAMGPSFHGSSLCC